RPRHRLREDRRAQPGAAAPARRDRRDRPPGGDRHLAQELPRQDHRPRRGRAAAGHDRHQRAGLRARRRRVPRARRGRGGRRPEGHRCYGRLRRMDEPEHLEPDEGEEDEGGPVVTVEITGLSLYTHHGVGEAEREVGQRLVFDLQFELSDCDATLTDRIEDTVDYADVCEQVAFAAQERSYKTLERLCAAVADRMIERYDPDWVTVRATKPEPPIPLPVEEVSVEVSRENH